MPNGPLLVYGNITVKQSNGETYKKIKSLLFADVVLHPINPTVMALMPKMVLWDKK
jgi:hypothetical protein